MLLPTPRGDLSAALVADLLGHTPRRTPPPPAGPDDAALTLWMLYELHYRGFEGVGDDREWDPELIRLRALLERDFEARLRERTSILLAEVDAPRLDGVAALTELTRADLGPSLAQFLHREASLEQYLEFLTQRSLYHLKESDPHAFAVPRLDGGPKVALAELQYDEFGGGRPERLHSRLFADALASVGLDPSYGAYVDAVPAYTLDVNNAMSLFGLHRRLRGACMGHLAAFEMTSSIPCRRYLQGAERLDLPAAVRGYFDEHVEADAVHEQLAARDICQGLVDLEPALYDDVLFGAAACLVLDADAASAMIGAWTSGGSSLVGARSEAAA